MMARPGRTAAVVGAVVAFAAVTLMGMLAGSASASAPGSCLENVNVRVEPTADARIVALCEAGTAVTTGAVRNGFVRIENLGGWAAEQYIEVEGAPSSSTSRTAPSSSDDDAATTSTPSTTAPRSGGTGDDSTADDDAATSRTGDDDVQDSTPDSTADRTAGDDAQDEAEADAPRGLLG